MNTIVPSYLPTSHPSRKARVALAVLVLASLVAPLAHATSIDGIGASSETFRTAITRHSLRTLDGRTFTLASLRGQVVVVNFWASWCPPCRRELPGLSSLHREIAKDGGLVIAISIDQDVRNVERFAKARGLALPIAQDGPDGLARELNLGHIPFTLVLDRQGVIAATATGGDAASLEKISTTARRLLTQTPPVSQAVSGGTP